MLGQHTLQRTYTRTYDNVLHIGAATKSIEGDIVYNKEQAFIVLFFVSIILVLCHDNQASARMACIHRSTRSYVEEVIAISWLKACLLVSPLLTAQKTLVMVLKHHVVPVNIQANVLLADTSCTAALFADPESRVVHR